MLVRPLGIRVSRFIAFIFLATVLTGHVFAQTSSGTLRGKVTDPSGAVIAGANITATAAAGQQTSVVSNGQGGYEIKGLAPGTYTVSAVAEGFATDVEPNVTITADQVQQFDLALGIVVKQEKVEVQADAATVGVSPDDSAAATVIKGKDLEALSDDPDELQSELEALAGPSAGPNGGQIYIDGFTGGQLPPKASIREIRLNQNPFSPEYDKLGYGRIEIFTKPGSDKFHGQVFFNENNAVFNTKNPFAASEPGYHTEIYDGNIGGPINKKASFFVDGELRKINNVSIIDATLPDFNSPTGESEFRQSLLSPSWRANVSPRLDYQVSTNNTLTMRYQFEDDRDTNGGIGQFSLAPQAYNSHELEQTIQVSDTQILSANIINETRFRFRRDTSEQTPTSTDPAIEVPGAFTTGGSADGRYVDHANQFELQNYTSVTHGKHFWKFGVRLRDVHDSNESTENFNGVFSFASLADYVIAAPTLPPTTLAQDVGMICVQSLLATPPISPKGLADCGATQFSQNTGEPTSRISVFDAGLYLSDDWRIRPNITFSYGLRFETQNQIHDRGDFAPRLSLAWGVDGGAKKTPKTVLRAGWGMFYDRFQYDLALRQDRLNGFTQQRIIVEASDLVPPPILPAPTIYQTNPDLRAPYTIQSALSLERQLTKSSTLAVTYLNSVGDHQFFTRNINPADIDTGDRPLGGVSNIYQYTSEGAFRQNQLIVNGRVGMGAKLSLFGFYTLSYANSDTGGASTFPTNQFDPSADYGRASYDVRHRIFLGGSVTLPYALTLNPLIVLNSGSPFDVTVGEDLNGDSIFNDRPGIQSTLSCATNTVNGDGTVCTPLGTFNPVLGAPNTVPINYGTGPWTATVNLRLSKTFGFGKKSDRASGGGPGGGGFPGGGGGGGRGAPGGGLGGRGLSGGGGNPFGGGVSTNRRYNLTVSVSARNLFNRVNLGTPTGVLSSPNFDESTTIAGGPFNSQTSNRRIDLQARFTF